MLKTNIIYLTVVSVIAINSLAFAGDSEDVSPQGRGVRVIEGKPLASTEEEALPDLVKGIGSTEDLIKEGMSGSIPASKIVEALKDPNLVFTENGRTYKILNEHIPLGLLYEMADKGESIRGNVQQTLGPNGIGWKFHYGVPATYEWNNELVWSLHPSFTGATLDFQVEDITPHPPSSAWYEFWK